MFKIIKNKDKTLCCAYRCKNKRPAKDRFCPKHRHRYNKEKRFLEYTYYAWRSNAIRRKKPFSVTLEQFKQFCEETNYLELKGKHKNAMTIDRIKSNLGYEIGNIQIMRHGENSTKQNKDCPF